MNMTCTCYPTITAGDVYDAYCQSHHGIVGLVEEFLHELATEFKGCLDDMADKYIFHMEAY